MSPSVLTLNVSRPPVARARQLLEYLWHREEEILVLTEISRSPGSDLIASVCRGAGFAVHSSLADEHGRPYAGIDRSALGVLEIGRGVALDRVTNLGPPDLLPGRILTIDLAEGPPLRIIGTYGAASDPVRYASSVQRQRKREWLLAFCRWLADLEPAPSLLVGDLNIVAPGHAGTLPYVLAEERTAYELITRTLGWRDLYADQHAGSPAAHLPTWVDHSAVGCRYDYVLAGPGEQREWSVAIDETPRLGGLTDHAAVVARPVPAERA